MDVTLYAVCLHPFHVLSQVQELSESKSNFRCSICIADGSIWSPKCIHTIHTSAAQAFTSETTFKLRRGTIDWRLLRLVHGATRITEFGPKLWEQARLNGFRCHQTEKCVMFDACFPQFFRSTMVGQFETNRRLVLLKFTGTNFYVEVMSFIRNLQNFGPCKAIDA